MEARAKLILVQARTPREQPAEDMESFLGRCGARGLAQSTCWVRLFARHMKTLQDGLWAQCPTVFYFRYPRASRSRRTLGDTPEY